MKKYYLRNKTYGTYYKSRYSKGNFHWVVDICEAKALTKAEANKLLNEIKNKENFEVIEKEERLKNDKETK